MADASASSIPVTGGRGGPRELRAVYEREPGIIG
jgi:hypothetical protein